MVSNKFVWPGLSKQVRVWAQQCFSCQRSKVHRHTRAPLSTFEVPNRRFDHIHVDLVGPLPSSQGFTYLLTVVDRFTRWPEAIPLTSVDTKRGVQFTSQLWSLNRETKFFKIDIGGKMQTISIDRLKPAHVDTSKEVLLAVLPRRGRPPRNSLEGAVKRTSANLNRRIHSDYCTCSKFPSCFIGDPDFPRPVETGKVLSRR